MVGHSMGTPLPIQPTVTTNGLDDEFGIYGCLHQRAQDVVVFADETRVYIYSRSQSVSRANSLLPCPIMDD